MNLQQLNPWNWFKHEENRAGSAIPVKRNETAEATPRKHQSAVVAHSFPNWPLMNLHTEIDRVFDQVFRGFGLPSLYDWNNPDNAGSPGFQAKLNVASDDREYHISVEAPGLTEKDISLELNQGVLIIHGEKKEENETRDRHYYRVERSYGSFQRVLNLPDDSDQDAISATMKHGLLEINIPRKAVATTASKRIPIH